MITHLINGQQVDGGSRSADVFNPATGKVGEHGPDAVRFYTRRKQITQRWPSAGVRERAVFAFPSSN